MEKTIKLVIIDKMILEYQNTNEPIGLCFMIKKVLKDKLLVTLFPQLSIMDTRLENLIHEIPELFESIFAERGFSIFNSNAERVEYLSEVKYNITNNINVRRIFP